MRATIQRRQGVGYLPSQPFNPEVHEQLWSQVPAKFRNPVYDLSDPDFGRIFANTHTKWAVLNVERLPPVMAQELAWWVWHCGDSGARRLNPGWMSTLVLGLQELLAASGPSASSLTEVDPAAWLKALKTQAYRRRGRLLAASSMTNARHDLDWIQAALRLRHSPLSWWQHDIWSPLDDPRIPINGYEPSSNHRICFAHMKNPWLKEALKYRYRLLLETGAGTWGTLLNARTHLGRYFDEYVADTVAATGIDHGPRLVEDPAEQARAFALEYLAHLRTRASGATAPGRSLSLATISQSQSALRMFYEFAFDNRRELATVLAEPRWLELTESHTRLYLPCDALNQKPTRFAPASPGRGAIAAEDLSRMLEHLEVLGLPNDRTHEVVIDGAARTVSGLNDPGAMRVWLLQAMTGRRANEILKCAFNPLEQVDSLTQSPQPSTTTTTGGDDEVEQGAGAEFMARFFYRQTKIDGAPSSILVGRDVVTVIEDQQRSVRALLALSADEPDPPYLFPALRRNLRGLRPRPSSGYHAALTDLTELLDLRDRHGNLLAYSKSHRLRHTKATTLLNLGAPIHVVMRYMGHRSPEMTLHYAATLAETAEREFLRTRAIGRDGRELDLTGADLSDMLALTSRTDRVLPTGLCMLPPTKHCDRGNACYSCHFFATDARHLAEHQQLLTETLRLIEKRKQLHLGRTGQPMSEDNVWLEQQLATVRSLQLIIARLEAPRPALESGPGSGAQGAGVRGRPGYQSTEPVTITIGPRPGGNT